MAYYDGTKLLSMLDIDGNKPEIYICTSNRTGGKTTYFSRYLMNRFINYGEKFILIYRFNYELDSVADKFFKDINSLFFEGYSMKSEKRARGLFVELMLKAPSEKEYKSCGYAVTINSASTLKNCSHLLSDAVRMLFDEFQPESNQYVPNEIRKFQSLHTSLARGQGKQVKYLPIIMLSNTVSIINPYYH